ncbi:MAG: MmcQ/YjbR family DNA-binding protein [bacterium]
MNQPKAGLLTAKDFRRIALGMKDAVESAHMGHPDFRVNGRVFATLHHDHHWGMVKLRPDQQRTFVRENPATFVPESGAWGRQGCTAVRLDSVDEDTLGEALTLAWQNTAGKRGAARSTPGRSSRPVRRSRKR